MRHPCSRPLADATRVYGDIAPTYRLNAMVSRRLFQRGHTESPQLRVLRKECHRNRVAQPRRQLQTHFARHTLHELVRHLHQHARAVTCVGIASAGAPMCQVVKDFDAVRDYFMTHYALDIRHYADAASIVLLLWDVESVVCDVLETRALLFKGGADATVTGARYVIGLAVVRHWSQCETSAKMQ